METTGNIQASTKITGKPAKRSLLTEELPGGGLTQEDFEYAGRNPNSSEVEEEEEEDEAGE